MKFFKNADLFSSPFTFSADAKSKKKRTKFGGILSIIVIFISLGYLLYLLYMYFNNQFLPKVSKEQFNNLHQNSGSISESIIKYKMIINGLPLEEFEAVQNKKYLEFIITHETYSQSGATYTDIPQINCDRGTGDFGSFTCMDIDQMTEEQKHIITNPLAVLQTNYAIQIMKCQNYINCADESEIDEFINLQNTYLIVYSGLQQYNITTQTIQTNYYWDYYQFDNQLFLESTYSLKKTITKIIDGLIIQSSTFIEHMSEYTKQSRQLTHSNSVTSFLYNGYGYISYKMDQTYQRTSVQYPMITEILSQCNSIFKILLFIGIFAKMYADSDISLDLNNLLLKGYYKHTAINYISTKTSQPLISNTDLNHNMSARQLADQIIQQNEAVKQMEYIYTPTANQRVPIFQKIKERLFGKVSSTSIKVPNDKLKKSNKPPPKISVEESIHNQMKHITTNQSSITCLIEDLTNLKTAVKLLLTQDQYAAIYFCGRDVGEIEDTSNDHEQQKLLNSNDEENVITYKTQLSANMNNFIRSNKESKVNMLASNQQSPIEQSIKLDEIQLEQLKEKNNPTSISDICNEIETSPKQIVLREIKENHLESIDKLEESDQKKKELLFKFLQKVNSTKILSTIDQNIYSSLFVKQRNKGTRQFIEAGIPQQKISQQN